jgi:hypothetical protein
VPDAIISISSRRRAPVTAIAERGIASLAVGGAMAAPVYAVGTPSSGDAAGLTAARFRILTRWRPAPDSVFSETTA